MSEWERWLTQLRKDLVATLHTTCYLGDFERAPNGAAEFQLRRLRNELDNLSLHLEELQRWQDAFDADSDEETP